MSEFPPPPSIGFNRFPAWRTGQPDAIKTIWNTKKRFVGLCEPTGIGKTLIYVAASRIFKKTFIVTGTKGLMDQLLKDFSDVGMVDVRGQANYPCRDAPGRVTCDMGHCHFGQTCDLKSNGCDYYDAVRTACRQPLAVTNYGWWLNRQKYSEPVTADLVVLDEAHDAPDHVSSLMTTELYAGGIGLVVKSKLPAITLNQRGWTKWAESVLPDAEAAFEKLKAGFARGAGERRRRQAASAKNAVASIKELASMKGKWVWEDIASPSSGLRGVRFQPIWPGPYAQKYLYGDAKRVVLVSATLRPKTLDLLGIPENEYEWHETPSPFDVRRRPLWYFPRAKVDQKMTSEDNLRLIRGVDKILDARQEVKGVIHTVSYKRAQDVMEHSSWRDSGRLVDHNSKNFAERLSYFLKSKEPLVFVSPVAMQGLDLRGSLCRFQIIIKIPFPYTLSPLARARQAADPKWGYYVAAQSLVQAYGRGMRSRRDWCETFILDWNWTWARKALRPFMPLYVLRAIKKVPTIPRWSKDL